MFALHSKLPLEIYRDNVGACVLTERCRWISPFYHKLMLIFLPAPCSTAMLHCHCIPITYYHPCLRCPVQNHMSSNNIISPSEETTNAIPGTTLSGSVPVKMPPSLNSPRACVRSHWHSLPRLLRSSGMKLTMKRMTGHDLQVDRGLGGLVQVGRSRTSFPVSICFQNARVVPSVIPFDWNIRPVKDPNVVEYVVIITIKKFSSK